MKFQKIKKRKVDTITNSDIHCSKSSLIEMIEITNQNVKNFNPISKEDNYSKTFLKSALKSERQLLV